MKFKKAMREPWLLATARSIALNLKARSCDDRAPLKHIDERRREAKGANTHFPFMIMLQLCSYSQF